LTSDLISIPATPALLVRVPVTCKSTPGSMITFPPLLMVRLTSVWLEDILRVPLTVILLPAGKELPPVLLRCN
jgi:hypothetical protein